MKSTNPLKYTLGCLLLFFTFSSVTQVAKAQMEPNIIHHILKGDSEAVLSALSNGADVDQQSRVGNTPLMAAAKIGDRRTVEALLSYNADVNLRNKAGGTALMIAAKYNNPHIVADLLNQGADPTIKTNTGYTASSFALGYKHYGIYDQLKLAETDFLAGKTISYE